MKLQTLTKKMSMSFVAVVLLTFTFFIFAPIDLFFSQHNEFSFSLSHILPMLIGLFIGGVAVLLSLCAVIPQKALKYVLAFFYASAFTIYLQGNFLPNNFGSLNGEEIKWSAHIGSIVVSSLVMLAIFITVFYFARKTKKALGIYKRIGLAIIAIQIVALCSPIISFSQINNEPEAVLSTERQFDVSKKSNTIVFVLDCFDSSVFKELLEKQKSSMEKEWEDFVYYPNIVAGAARTKYAIPFILTGHTNTEPISYIEYLRRSFNKSELIKTLNALDYDARLYTTKKFIDTNQTKAFQNLVTSKIEINSKASLTALYLRLVAFRYAPAFTKRFFWLYSGDFDKYIATSDILCQPYKIDDAEFYQMFKERGLALTDDRVFRFYHLRGAHPPYTLNERAERVRLGESDEIRQAVGSLNIVQEYLSQLKRLGVYDNSEIFVMSDHGCRGIDQNPLFMIKERNSRAAFTSDEIALSYKDLVAMFSRSLEQAPICVSDFDCKNKIRYYYRQFVNRQELLTEYASSGYAGDAGSFYTTGKIYYGNSKKTNHNYKLGTQLSFESLGTANQFAKHGFSKNEGTHTWTDGIVAEMEFKLKGKYKNIKLDMTYKPYGKQSVVVYANGTLVADYVARREEAKSVVIPGDCVGKDKTLILRFSLPNAVAPSKLGLSKDGRRLALAFHSLTLSSTNDPVFDLQTQSSLYDLGAKLSFAKTDGDTARPYERSGFSHTENDFTWTVGNRAVMRFLLGAEIKKDLVCVVDYFTFDGDQPVTVYAGDAMLESYTANGQATKSFLIPTSCVKNRVLELVFDLPGARSPAGLGQSDDVRNLALAFKSIVIKESRK